MVGKELVRASQRLNEFLKGFVDQTGPEHTREWREQTWSHRYFRNPPDLTAVKSSLFYGDADFRFTETLFLGVELDLLLFNILTFAVTDLMYDNTMASIVTTYLAELLVITVRQELGQANLASKTLVDDRFLV